MASNALNDRVERLAAGDAAGWVRAMRAMEREIWPAIPAAELGRRLSREEEDAILGYGPEGV